MKDKTVFLKKYVGIITAILTILVLFFIGYSYGRSAKFHLIIVFGVLFISILFMIVGWVWWPK